MILLHGYELLFNMELMVSKLKFEIAPGFENLEGWLTNIRANFSSGGETIFKVRNEVKVFEVDGVRINVKSFKLPNLINRYAYVYLRGSKAKRSFEYASRLEKLNVPTPQPVAYVEYRAGGVLCESYYVSLQFDYDFTLREVLEKKINEREILKEWVKFTSEKLHKNGVFHLDYSPGNTLIRIRDKKIEFAVIDLNRMNFGAISFVEGLKNFRQMYIPDSDFEFIAKEYARLNNEDEDLAIDLLFGFNKKYKQEQARKKRMKNRIRR